MMTKEEFYQLNVATVRAVMVMEKNKGSYNLGTSDIFTDTFNNMYQLLEIKETHLSFNAIYSAKDNEYQIVELKPLNNLQFKGDELKVMAKAATKLAKDDPIEHHQVSPDDFEYEGDIS